MDADYAGGASPPASTPKPDDFTTVLLRMDKRQQQHGEILVAILKILTPSDDKPQAGDLVKELISRIDRQTAMIRSLLVAIEHLGKELPQTVIRMLHSEGDDDGHDHGHDGNRGGTPVTPVDQIPSRTNGHRPA